MVSQNELNNGFAVTSPLPAAHILIAFNRVYRSIARRDTLMIPRSEERFGWILIRASEREKERYIQVRTGPDTAMTVIDETASGVGDGDADED